jgi:Protein of unknown function (DUF1615)
MPRLPEPARCGWRRGQGAGPWLAASLLAGVLMLAGCASGPPVNSGPTLTPDQARAQIRQAIPANTPDRAGWATDIYASMAVLQIPPSADNTCAVLAVIEQESTYRSNPPVPGLAEIAWREIDAKAERAGVPKLLVRTALKLNSPTGQSYSARIDAATTELDLSRVFDDLIDTVPMGKRLFGRWNPVRTAGPMQVSIAYAEAHAERRTYPYPLSGTLRDEVFTRRGGLYFGIAHLLDYPANYDALIYRYADFNAGHHASRNAAFQQAVSTASGIPLDLDGDLIAHNRDTADGPGSTELATRILGERLGLDEGEIRRALLLGQSPDFERSTLYQRVFALAERTTGQALPRAVLPRIVLKSPKITRTLTTEWFARRVDERHKRCLARLGGAAN